MHYYTSKLSIISASNSAYLLSVWNVIEIDTCYNLTFKMAVSPKPADQKIAIEAVLSKKKAVDPRVALMMKAKKDKKESLKAKMAKMAAARAKGALKKAAEKK